MFSKGCRWSDAECVQEVFIGESARLEHEKTSVEVEWRRRGVHVSRPRHLVRALLAVANGVLFGVAPCLFAETVHDSVEVAVGGVEEVVYVVVHLDVCVQVHHLVVLLKLCTQAMQKS